MDYWEKISNLTKDDVKPGEKYYGYAVADEDDGVYLFPWAEETKLFQYGKCTNPECETTNLVSWAKNVICPTCGTTAYLT